MKDLGFRIEGLGALQDNENAVGELFGTIASPLSNPKSLLDVP